MLKKHDIGIFPALFRENPLPVTFFDVTLQQIKDRRLSMTQTVRERKRT